VSSTYGQYCPLALAAEVLGERWSILVLSRLLDGCCRFAGIRRGLPRIPVSTLTARLRSLEEAGLVTRQLDARGAPSYALTEAGRALEPIIDQMTAWGHAWGRDMNLEDLDPRFLAWSMHSRLNVAVMPRGRTVLKFEFSGVPANCRYFWLVHEGGAVDMCLKDPGFAVDVEVQGDLRVFVEAWRGFRSMRAEIDRGAIRVTARASLRRAFPDWLLLSMAAPVERRRPGPERGLSQQARG
jgi:DNA-binding HxlR family transcriptional regulator